MDGMQGPRDWLDVVQKNSSPPIIKKGVKIAIIGKGTGGIIAALYFSKWAPPFFPQGCTIEVYYDPDISAVHVGEGSQLSLPNVLWTLQNMTIKEAGETFNASHKVGIQYNNWGNKGDYFHSFPGNNTAMHFSAKDFQEYWEKELAKQGVKFIPKKVKKHSDIDADFIMDARGAPKLPHKDYESFEYSLCNSALVAQCPTEYPLYNYTIAEAMPNGWIFGIPLQNRISYGYIFNKEISDKSIIEEELKEFINKKDLTHKPFNHIQFQSYHRKLNWPTWRTAYIGNASYFCEPLEATAIELQCNISDKTLGIWTWYQHDNRKSMTQRNEANQWYYKWCKEAECIIMMHYCAYNKNYDTKFWTEARLRASACLTNNNDFQQMCREAFHYDRSMVQHLGLTKEQFETQQARNFGGGWNLDSFRQNIAGLGL